LARAAVAEACKDRDMEWWEALVLVDNVAPTPEAARDWLARLAQCEREEARREQREKDAEIAKECRHLHGDSVANAILSQKEPTT